LKAAVQIIADRCRTTQLLLQ